MITFGPRDRLHSGGGSCPRTAPPVLGTKNTCHGRRACAAGGAPRPRSPTAYVPARWSVVIDFGCTRCDSETTCEKRYRAGA